MTIKLKSSGKSKSVIKKTLKVKPYKKSISKQDDLFQLSKDIISNIGVGIYIVQHGKFIFTSPLYQRLTGYSVTEIIGHNSLDRVHPDHRAMVRTKAIKSLKGESHSYEYRFIRKNGEEMWILEMITSIIYKGEHAALGSFMDITEYKRMENELHRSEEKYRTILENIEDGYAETDLRGNFIFFNESLSRIQGYPKEELVKKNYRDLMDEENAKEIFARYNKVFTTGKSEKDVPYEIITKSGLKRHLETSITPMKDAPGQIFAFRGIVRDVTEHKQAEEALVRERKFSDVVVNSSPGLFFVFDDKGNIIQSNRNAEKVTGYSTKEISKMNILDFVAKEDQKTAAEAIQEVLTKGQSSSEIKILSKPGKKTTFYTTGLRTKFENTTCVICTGSDITERKQHEEELALLRAAMDVSKDMVFLVDRTTS